MPERFEDLCCGKKNLIKWKSFCSKTVSRDSVDTYSLLNCHFQTSAACNGCWHCGTLMQCVKDHIYPPPRLLENKWEVLHRARKEMIQENYWGRMECFSVNFRSSERRKWARSFLINHLCLLIRKKTSLCLFFSAEYFIKSLWKINTPLF